MAWKVKRIFFIDDEDQNSLTHDLDESFMITCIF